MGCFCLLAPEPFLFWKLHLKTGMLLCFKKTPLFSATKAEGCQTEFARMHISKIQINFGPVCQNLLSATKYQRRLVLTKITEPNLAGATIKWVLHTELTIMFISSYSVSEMWMQKYRDVHCCSSDS